MVRHRIGGLFVALMSITLLVSTSIHATPPQQGVTLIGAGDIATCNSDGSKGTADIIERYPDARVFTLGDNAYEDGTDEDYTDCYDPTWGKFKDRTYPSIGNHDYGQGGYEGYSDDPAKTYSTTGYSNYFGLVAGAKDDYWYSYDLGNWHIVVLNSDCDNGVSCDKYSKQMQWLDEDLSATSKPCIAAMWHHPLFSSGYHGDDPKMRAAWNELYAYHADLVLNGHEHDYELFEKQDPYGNVTPRGIREIVVGTGGASLRSITKQEGNSLAFDNSSHGVLALELKSNSYTWNFIPSDGYFTNSGSTTCNPKDWIEAQ